MSYEEAFKYMHAVIEAMLEEEDTLSKTTSGDSIYVDSNPAYTVFSFMYPNLYNKEQQDKLDSTFGNVIREQLMKRVRSKQMQVVALTGNEFVERITKNLIDVISRNDPNTSSASRKRLTTYFKSRSMTWFCAMASCVYTGKMIAYAAKTKQSSLQPAQKLSATAL